jgi:glycosyltransferase involved in cell wall biosynthesis
MSHPGAGGAEVFTEEVGKRLVDFGNEVTIFTSAFNRCEHETLRSGMRILRKGGKYGVYAEGRDYVKRHISEFDVIVDEINTIPFQIPKVVKNKPIIALIHQLAREIWFYETRFPISVLGYFALEPLWLRQYRRVPTITVSNSTKTDLIRRGFQRVQVIHNGIKIQPLAEIPRKAPEPILIFVGRLVRSKRPNDAISAFKYVKDRFADAQLWILGDGYMRRKLDRGTKGIRFFGRVDDLEKFELLKKAHVLLVPSVREGWGVSVIEANAMGTPAVGYAVPGLRDSISDEVTGLLVKSKSPKALADGANRLLSDTSTRRKLSTASLEWARGFSWDEAAKQFDLFLKNSAQDFGFSI